MPPRPLLDQVEVGAGALTAAATRLAVMSSNSFVAEGLGGAGADIAVLSGVTPPGGAGRGGRMRRCGIHGAVQQGKLPNVFRKEHAVNTGSSETGPNRCSHQRSFHVLQTLTTRRAVRAFADRPVDDSLLEPMLDAMLAAPSASNKQAWAFVAVREPRTLRLLRAFSPGVIELPPLIVAACFDRSRAVGGSGASGASDASRDSWDEGMLCVAMAVENLLLAAHCLGLGGCPSGSFRPGPVRRFLGLPEHLEPLLLVPIGHPARPLAPAPRRDRTEVVSHERWGD